ncbi:MAG: type II toxin-antitoxin system RelE family toxin [Solirubrobacterales bacterium]
MGSEAPRCRVELAPVVAKQLRRLPPGDAARFRAAILALALDSRPSGATKLTGTDYPRLRVGELRVIYVVDDTTRQVAVLKVARRAESIYRRIGYEEARGRAEEIMRSAVARGGRSWRRHELHDR